MLHLLCRAMQLFVGGYEVTQLEGQGDELYVHRKALKALHVLFDMEVRSMGSCRLSMLTAMGHV